MKTSSCLSVLTALMACGPTHVPPAELKEQAAPPEHTDEPEHEALAKRVTLTPDVVSAIGVRTEATVAGHLASVVALSGEVVADPDRTARLTSSVAGRIETVDLQEGATVAAGQVLAVLTIPELGRLGAAQAGVTAKARAARANAKRLHELSRDGLAPRQEALVALADAEALEAEATGIGKELAALGGGNQARLSLRSPRSGTVIQRDAIVGTPVDTQHVLATISDLSEVWFVARLFERDLDRVRVGAAVEVLLNAHPKRHFSGTVEAIGSQVDPAARTVTARIRLKNTDGLLRLGLFGIAEVETGLQDAGPMLTVPRSAVTEIGGKPIVFVRQADGDFEVHDVTLGPAALGRVVVLVGLRLGEQVVVDGVFNLKSVLLRGSLAEED